MSKHRAIIIAAGTGSRLRPLTNDLPKCMLKVEEKTLLEHCIQSLKENEINHISIVTGHKSKEINLKGLFYFHNDNYLNNNILHSLMYARKELENAIQEDADMIISYSDIWFHSSLIKTLLKSKGEINILVDSDWERSYEGRTDHPISEAEIAVLGDDETLQSIGKNASSNNEKGEMIGEFIGLVMMKPSGIKMFLNHFDKVNSTIAHESPFQRASEWRKSYLTDIFQDMIEVGISINCSTVEGKWKEFDTIQDFERGLPF